MIVVFIIVLLLLAALGAPLFALIAAIALFGFNAAGQPGTAVAIEFYRLADMPALIAIPLFTLAGYLLAESQAPPKSPFASCDSTVFLSTMPIDEPASA